MSTSGSSNDWGYLPPERPEDRASDAGESAYPRTPPAAAQLYPPHEEQPPAYRLDGPVPAFAPDEPAAAYSASEGADWSRYASRPAEPPAQPAQQAAPLPADRPAERYDLPAQTIRPPIDNGPLLAPPERHNGHFEEPGISEANYARHGTETPARSTDLALADLLAMVLDYNASDLHLTAKSPPMFRLRGELTTIGEHPSLDADAVQRMLYAILTQKQREIFEAELELDFAYTLPGRGRFRVNLYRQRNALGAAFRLIPFEIKPLEELGVPESVAAFASLPRGFVLVTGPTGSGKSTTLASLIDLANRSRRDHIMTVEDPIEFLHQHKSCIVNQREVGEDTRSFSAALKHALRQDPDIILVGELRDLETISVALTAAETGHLVFATLHTQDAPQTIDRLIDVFPAHQQQQVRVQLAGALQGVVTQTLCKTADGTGRAVATEVMMATPAIRNLIREGKTHQIYSAMQAGSQHGMHTLDQHLADLVRRQVITLEVAEEKCHDAHDLHRLLGRA